MLGPPWTLCGRDPGGDAGDVSASWSHTQPERRHLGRRSVLTLVVLLAVAGISGLLVGLVVKTVVRFLVGLV